MLHLDASLSVRPCYRASDDDLQTKTGPEHPRYDWNITMQLYPALAGLLLLQSKESHGDKTCDELGIVLTDE